MVFELRSLGLGFSLGGVVVNSQYDVHTVHSNPHDSADFLPITTSRADKDMLEFIT